MIGYLRGKILENQDGRVLLGVAGSSDPEAPMVGYQLSVPQGPERAAYSVGSTGEFYVHTHVREDALDLYGFASTIEKDIFLQLLSVSGIGPKGALGLLTQLPAPQLVDCVLRGDRDTLVKTPGVGKKTAERLVLELADPFRKKTESGAWGTLPSVGAGVKNSAPAGAVAAGPGAFAPSLRGVIREATEALVSLGYREQQVQSVLEGLVQELGAGSGGVRTEQLIRGALRSLG
jgi:Holliday junction DNA helicase RuvA